MTTQVHLHLGDIADDDDDTVDAICATSQLLFTLEEKYVNRCSISIEIVENGRLITSNATRGT